MPQNAFVSMNSRSSGQTKNDAKTLFSTLHPLSLVIFATATVVAFVLLRNSRFSFHCYTQRVATPTQKSARKWRCDLSRLLARKITRALTRADQLHWIAEYHHNYYIACILYHYGYNYYVACILYRHDYNYFVPCILYRHDHNYLVACILYRHDYNYL